MEGKNKAFDRNISHSNMIVVTKDEKGVIDDDTLIYFGSHNFSSAAWCKEEKGGKQISLSNWELGVVYLPEEGSRERKRNIIDSLNVKFPP